MALKTTAETIVGFVVIIDNCSIKNLIKKKNNDRYRIKLVSGRVQTDALIFCDDISHPQNENDKIRHYVCRHFTADSSKSRPMILVIIILHAPQTFQIL